MLSQDLAEDLIAQLMVRYGDAWVRKWEHISDPNLVLADWRNVLDGSSSAAIWYGLQNLPDSPFPPNALEFRAICLRYSPPDPIKRLPAPERKADPARVRRLLAAALKKAGGKKEDPLAWARELKAREKAGEPLSEAKRLMWREALKNEVVRSDVPIVITPIPDHMLPPGMRKEEAPHS